MDGNGRWARQRGKPRIAGHRKGMDVLRSMVEAAGEAGVRYLTVFAFSSENWKRPATEVQLLMDLFANALDNEAAKLAANGVGLRVVGDVARFGDRISRLIRRATALPVKDQALTLTVCANYGGRWELVRAARELVQDARRGELEAEDVDEAAIARRLPLGELPEPELLIRTGGEWRVSNFLLWHLAYTELYFTDVLWPDFDALEFQRALDWFAQRERRFGRTGDQLRVRSDA
jgi:undecaprenyl diphosphate synthase